MVVVLISTVRLENAIKKEIKNQKTPSSTSPEQSLAGRSQAGHGCPEFQASAQHTG